MYNNSLKFPFSSARKRMSMVIELEGGRKRLVSKGASEMVLAACNKYHSKSGNKFKFFIIIRVNHGYR
jgi:magnesium-transporting ATPase (P-type)